MSIQSWMEEFFPVDATTLSQEFSKGNVKDIDLINHSIRKWEGVLPDALSRHGLLHVSSMLISEDHPIVESNFQLGSKNCSLCAIYVEQYCIDCPLYKEREGYSCDEINDEDAENGLVDPWSEATDHKDPKPMLMWLKRAAKSTNKTTEEKNATTDQ